MTRDTERQRGEEQDAEGGHDPAGGAKHTGARMAGDEPRRQRRIEGRSSEHREYRPEGRLAQFFHRGERDSAESGIFRYLSASHRPTLLSDRTFQAGHEIQACRGSPRRLLVSSTWSTIAAIVDGAGGCTSSAKAGARRGGAQLHLRGIPAGATRSTAR